MKVWNYDTETEANVAHLNGTDLASYPDKEYQMEKLKDPKDEPCTSDFQGLIFGVRVQDGLSWITVDAKESQFCGNVTVKLTCPI
jgi:3-methyladenine DNA glycosylase Tag